MKEGVRLLIKARYMYTTYNESLFQSNEIECCNVVLKMKIDHKKRLNKIIERKSQIIMTALLIYYTFFPLFNIE